MLFSMEKPVLVARNGCIESLIERYGDVWATLPGFGESDCEELWLEIMMSFSAAERCVARKASTQLFCFDGRQEKSGRRNRICKFCLLIYAAANIVCCNFIKRKKSRSCWLSNGQLCPLSYAAVGSVDHVYIRKATTIDKLC